MNCTTCSTMRIAIAIALVPIMGACTKFASPTNTKIDLGSNELSFTLQGEITGTQNIVANGNTKSAITVTLRKVDQKTGVSQPAVGVTPKISTTSADTTITACTASDSHGVSTCGASSPVAGTKSISVIEPVPLQISITFVAGPISKLIVVAGANQTALAGKPVAMNPRVRVTDANNNVISGAQVTFTASGDGHVDSNSAVTGANGEASCGKWTLGTTAGTNTLNISAGTVTAAITAVASAIPPVLTQLIKVTGDGQSAQVGQAVPESVYVRALDQFGNRMAEVTVTFSTAPAGGTALTSVKTNAEGDASPGAWTMKAVGTNTLTATAGGISQTFNATGIENMVIVYFPHKEGHCETGKLEVYEGSSPYSRKQFLTTGECVRETAAKAINLKARCIPLDSADTRLPSDFTDAPTSTAEYTVADCSAVY